MGEDKRERELISGSRNGSGNPHVELGFESSGEEGADTRRAAPNYGQGFMGEERGGSGPS